MSTVTSPIRSSSHAPARSSSGAGSRTSYHSSSAAGGISNSPERHSMTSSSASPAVSASERATSTTSRRRKSAAANSVRASSNSFTRTSSAPSTRRGPSNGISTLTRGSSGTASSTSPVEAKAGAEAAKPKVPSRFVIVRSFMSVHSLCCMRAVSALAHEQNLNTVAGIRPRVKAAAGRVGAHGSPDADATRTGASPPRRIRQARPCQPEPHRIP